MRTQPYLRRTTDGLWTLWGGGFEDDNHGGSLVLPVLPPQSPGPDQLRVRTLTLFEKVGGILFDLWSGRDGTRDVDPPRRTGGRKFTGVDGEPQVQKEEYETSRRYLLLTGFTVTLGDTESLPVTVGLSPDAPPRDRVEMALPESVAQGRGPSTLGTDGPLAPVVTVVGVETGREDGPPTGPVSDPGPGRG